MQMQADFALGLKGNQPTLSKDTADYFAAALADKSMYPEHQHIQTADKGHERCEIRHYYLTNMLDWLDNCDAWENLQGSGMAHTKADDGTKITEGKEK